MKEHPILFSAPMVRAILEGRKTQTRRVIKNCIGDGSRTNPLRMDLMKFPYSQIGDRLWVRENFRFGSGYDGVKPSDVPKEPWVKIHYEADGEAADGFGKLRPNIFLPRYFSRILLEITGIRVERLNDISEADALAEGSFLKKCSCFPPARNPIESMMKQTWCHQHGQEFKYLWESLNGPQSWDANPWVWVIEFKAVTP